MTPSTIRTPRSFPRSGKAGMGAALLAALLLSACASLPGADSGTPEEQVAKRAEQRWAALIKRDFAAAYAYNQPAYRQAISQETYQKGFGSAGQWKSAQVNRVTCEPERCTANVRLTVINKIPKFARAIPEITSNIDEVWIRDQGQWWHYDPTY